MCMHVGPHVQLVPFGGTRGILAVDTQVHEIPS